MTDELIIPAGYQVVDVIAKSEATLSTSANLLTVQVELKPTDSLHPRVAARAKQFARRAQEFHLPRRLRTRWKPTKHPAWMMAAIAEQKRIFAQAGIKGKGVGPMHDSIVLCTPPHSVFDYAQSVDRLERLRTTIEPRHGMSEIAIQQAMVRLRTPVEGVHLSELEKAEHDTLVCGNTKPEIVHLHTDRSKEIARAAFAPRPDLGLVKADLSEVELRSLEKPT